MTSASTRTLLRSVHGRSDDESLRLECARIAGDASGAREIYSFIKESADNTTKLDAARASEEGPDAKAS